jgi:hypothetical protein
MANEGDEIALASRLDAQHAEAVLGVVERDAVDQAGQNFGCRACPGWLYHLRRMNVEIRTCYRDRAPLPLPVAWA